MWTFTRSVLINSMREVTNKYLSPFHLGTEIRENVTTIRNECWHKKLSYCLQEKINGKTARLTTQRQNTVRSTLFG